MRHGPLLPVGPIKRVVVEWLEKYSMTHEELSFLVGVPPRAIYRIISEESKTISWENADAIVTRTIGPFHWHTDDDLAAIYPTVDEFARSDLTNPIQNPVCIAEADKKILGAFEDSATRGEAATKLGMSLASYSKILDPALERANLPRVRKRYPLSHCKRGHDISVYGREKDGMCRACKALRQRSHHQNKSGKTRAKRVNV